MFQIHPFIIRLLIKLQYLIYYYAQFQSANGELGVHRSILSGPTLVLQCILFYIDPLFEKFYSIKLIDLISSFRIIHGDFFGEQIQHTQENENNQPNIKLLCFVRGNTHL